MFLEYDVVVSKKKIDGIVPKGAKGAIVIVYDGSHQYEVEFVDDNGDTLAVVTVDENDIEKWEEDTV